MGVEGSGESKKLKSLCSRLALKDEFEGSEPDVEAANQLLERTGLLGDPNGWASRDIPRSEHQD